MSPVGNAVVNWSSSPESSSASPSMDRGPPRVGSSDPSSLDSLASLSLMTSPSRNLGGSGDSSSDSSLASS
jgi:hypothetical protein